MHYGDEEFFGEAAELLGGGRGLVFSGFGGWRGQWGVWGVLLSVGGRWAGGGRTGRCVSGGFRASRQ